MNSQDEKYISIEYELWMNKYKPLEEENIDLRRRLKESTIKVRILLNSFRDNEITEGEIGYVSFEVNKGWSVSIDNWKGISTNIENKMNNLMQSSRYYRRFITHGEMVKFIDEKKQVLAKIEEKINKIPKIIRWLFKIQP